MAYCSQTLTGINLDCTNNKGGIKTVHIANYDDIKIEKTVNANGIVTDITGITGEFKTYQFRKNTGSMTSTLTADETNGLNYVTTELSLVFTKMDTAKRLEMTALSLGQLAVIVEDANGIYWYLTPDDYASASAGTGETGTAKSDRNGYSLTLSVENDGYPMEIEETAVKEVIAE